MSERGLCWLSQGMEDAPADDAWLSPVEAGYVSRLRFPKRRTEFRLGRWTAKQALALYLGLPRVGGGAAAHRDRSRARRRTGAARRRPPGARPTSR